MKGCGLSTNKLFSTDVYHLTIRRLWTYMIKELILRVELGVPVCSSSGLFSETVFIISL
jgi:hypothetical protein